MSPTKHSTLSLVFSLSRLLSIVETKSENKVDESGGANSLSRKHNEEKGKNENTPALLSLPLKIFPPPSAPLSIPFISPRRQTSGGGARSALRRSGGARGASALPARSTSWLRSGSCNLFFFKFCDFFHFRRGELSDFSPCFPQRFKSFSPGTAAIGFAQRAIKRKDPRAEGKNRDSDESERGGEGSKKEKLKKKIKKKKDSQDVDPVPVAADGVREPLRAADQGRNVAGAFLLEESLELGELDVAVFLFV